MRSFFAIILIGLLLIPAPAWCWSGEGHKVVARIAAKHLTPAALARVAELLEVENTPDSVAEAMATAAIWADEIATETETANWHFLELMLQDGRAQMSARCKDNDCLTARIRLFADQLRANDPDADTRFTDTDALRFLLHLVADLHQPMHAISNADQSGDCEALVSTVDGAKTVHALWDGPLVSRMGADDAGLAADLEAEMGERGADEKAAFAGGDVEDWAWESHRLAMVNIYKRLAIPKQDVAFPASCSQAPDEIQQAQVVIEDEYLEAMRPVVREQLEKAGLRLAAMLNEILTTKNQDSEVGAERSPQRL